jgi:hypothetical protein
LSAADIVPQKKKEKKKNLLHPSLHEISGLMLSAFNLDGYCFELR